MDFAATSEGTRLAHHMVLKQLIIRLLSDDARLAMRESICGAIEAAHAAGALTVDQETLHVALSAVEDLCSPQTM
jgi:hypothetical protein